MPCFDASGFSFLPQSLFLTYRSQWNIFERIYYINSNVSTARSSGDTSQSYYQFKTSFEQADYINGQMLHVKRYPTSNWDSPIKS